MVAHGHDGGRLFTTVRKCGVAATLAVLLSLSSGSPANAQSGGLFGWLFGSGNAVRSGDLAAQERETVGAKSAPVAITVTPRPATNVSPPLSITVMPNYPPARIAVAYCVRLCDGRYFPMALSAGPSNATPLSLCKALCPASATRVYIGTDIAWASANGRRYAELNTAFLYRTQIVDDCTCNGGNMFGTAPIDVTADPTLRAGDIVATDDGLKIFTGTGNGWPPAARFRPIDGDRLLSANLRAKMKW